MTSLKQAYSLYTNTRPPKQAKGLKAGIQELETHIKDNDAQIYRMIKHLTRHIGEQCKPIIVEENTMELQLKCSNKLQLLHEYYLIQVSVMNSLFSLCKVTQSKHNKEHELNEILRDYKAIPKSYVSAFDQIYGDIVFIHDMFVFENVEYFLKHGKLPDNYQSYFGLQDEIDFSFALCRYKLRHLNQVLLKQLKTISKLNGLVLHS